MKSSLSRLVATGAVALATSALVFAGAVPANAETTTTLTVPMSSTGFDKNVATANGFEIRTNADGQEYSAPVSPAAVLAVERAAKSTGSTIQNTVNGNCGTSTLLMSRVGGTTSVRIGTSYRVKLPSASHKWSVNVINKLGVSSVNFDGVAGGTTWSAVRESVNVRTNQGTTAQVTPGSFAVLISGEICYSGSPTASV